MTTADTSSLSHVCTIADLAAVSAARSHTTSHSIPDASPAETCAMRALRAASVVIPYAGTTGSETEDPESALADLVADLWHLTDHLGLDWGTVTRRATGYHHDELTGGHTDAAVSAPSLIPELEIVVVRDPDSATEIEAYLGGEPIDFTDYIIDAGSGWDWEDWKEGRDTNLAAASPQARASLLAHYADPPGGQYVEDRDDEPWIQDDNRKGL